MLHSFSPSGFRASGATRTEAAGAPRELAKCVFSVWFPFSPFALFPFSAFAPFAVCPGDERRTENVVLGIPILFLGLIYMSFSVVVVDWKNEAHAEGVISLLQHYACGPTGGSTPISDEALQVIDYFVLYVYHRCLEKLR